MNNTTLYIQGDFQILSINPSPVRELINGVVYVEGNLVCNDKIIFEKDSSGAPNASTLQFVGSNDSYITGAVTPQIYRLNFDKSAGDVYINRDIEVHDTIEFIQGNGIIAQDVNVNLKYRQGSNTVGANPWLWNETAISRFTGDGYVTTTIETPSFDYDLPENFADIANIGFYFSQGQTDTLRVRRGHTKQLYAGEGSIDRFFDVSFTTANTPTFDSVGIRYLADVDYTALGVDTSKLKVYISPAFSDGSFVRGNDTYVDATRRNLNDGSAFENPFDVTPVSPIYYRFTLGDTTCSNPPYSTLPDTLIHLCFGETIEVSAMNQQVNGFNQVSYLWNDGNTDANRAFSADNFYYEYVVKLTDQRGCFTYDTLRIDSVAPNPIVNFTWTNVCEGIATQFVEGTTIEAGGTFTSSWNFGDGNTIPLASTATVFNTYAAAGAYDVSLTSTSNYGCTSTIMHVARVFNYPIPNLSVSTNCEFGEMTLDASGSSGTTIPLPSAISNTIFSIDTTDITGSNVYSFPLSTYSYGSHQVDLIVTSGFGCADTLTETITIYQQDLASFTASDVCLNDTLDLQNTSLIYNPNAVYSWSFGDNTYSSDFQPVKIYSSPGLHTIQLIVETDGPCADTFEFAVNVFDLPSSAFDTTTSCIGQNVIFSPTDFDVANSYSWDFGNGNTASGAFTNQEYSLSGNYDVVLNATDGNGCSSETIIPIQIMSGPQASFNALAVCQGSPTYFYNTSSSASASQWSFGDLTNSLATDPQHNYGTSGTYTVSLIVTDGAGCADTTVQAVTVHPLPVIPIGNVSTCGTSYNLDAQNTGSAYLWSPTNNISQTLNVTEDGTYTVQVTTTNGCSSSASATVILNTVVQPDLGPDLSACGETELDAGYAGANFVWNTTENSQSILANTAGTYWVEVTDQNGCTGSDTVEVLNVYAFTPPNLGSDLSLCESNFPINLNPGTYSSYLWSTQETTQSIALSGSNNVWVEVSDVNGCIGRDTIVVTSLNSPESTLSAIISQCDQATLVATTNTNYSSVWGGGQTGNFLVVSASGTYEVTITDPNTNCTVQDLVSVTIQASPIVNLGLDQSTCANVGITLDAQNSGSSYSWVSSSGAVVGTSQTYSPPSSGVYIVNVSNNGCSASDAINIQLLPAPFIPVQTSIKYICGTTPVVLYGSPFGNNVWTSPTGFSSTSQDVSVNENGFYTVNATIAGCSATETFELQTSPMQIEAYYLVDTDTLTNLSLKFVDLSTPTPLSYLWDFGDGMFDSIASPTHTYLVIDTFQTSLTVSNGFCISTYSKEVNAKDFFQGEDSDAAFLSIENFIVYPNPLTSEFTIDLTLTDYASTTMGIYDVNGKLTVDFDGIEHEKKVVLTKDLSDLNPGVYYLKIQSTSPKGNAQKVAKLIKL